MMTEQKQAQDYVRCLRHSTSHVMAQAVLEKFPEGKIADERIKSVKNTRAKMILEERSRLQALETRDIKKQLEWEQQKQNLKYRSFRGILRTASSSSQDSPTHLLNRHGERVCYLRSDTINLDKYLYRFGYCWSCFCCIFFLFL